MEPKKTRPWYKFNKINLQSVDRQSKKVEVATARHAKKFLLGRLENLQYIRRHLIGWLALLIMLIGLNVLQIVFDQKSVSVEHAAKDAAYAEGVMGPINNLNPLFSSTDAEISAGKLIFSSLLSYDTNGRLQGEVAESYKVDASGKMYTVNLRPDIRWHDGKPLTADDVVFTINAMKNPATGSRHYSSWQSIEVAASGPHQVTFTLPTSYAPFASAMTFPILPGHILGKIPPEQLQENDFSTKPVGSGPFKFIDLLTIDTNKDKKALQLTSNDDYWQGRPKLSRFSLYAYGSREDLANAVQRREVNAASGVKVAAIGLKNEDAVLNNGVFALLKTDSIILKDANVRKALVRGLDRQKIREQLGGKSVLEGPIINSQTPQASKVAQLGYNFAGANKILDASKWLKNQEGIRTKGGQALELRVVAVDTSNYRKLTKLLVQQWRKLGIKMEVQLIDPEQIQQIILRPRAYDILVYELSMGGDPDGYAFWHSSQASDSGLNFSDYESSSADDALVTARGRTDIQSRDSKYETFAKSWVADVPAIALYRSSLNYTTTEGTSSLAQDGALVGSTDRYYHIIDWSSEQARTYNTP